MIVAPTKTPALKEEHDLKTVLAQMVERLLLKTRDRSLNPVNRQFSR